MSKDVTIKRVTAPDIAKRKGGEPIVALTAYHAHTARIIDPYVDMLLVGDSLGMVMHGYETTVPVPLDLMIMHAQAVVRGSTRALVVVDMPFGSYEESPTIAFRNAARVLKETGCGAIKIEGGAHMAETIRYLSDARHPGDEPYRPDAAGGEHDRQLQAAGASPLRMGGVRGGCAAPSPRPAPSPSCWKRSPSCSPRGSPSRSPSRPSASALRLSATGRSSCLEDMLGLNPRVPKFVKEYAQLGDAIETAVKSYADEVRSRAFPTVEPIPIQCTTSLPQARKSPK